MSDLTGADRYATKVLPDGAIRVADLRDERVDGVWYSDDGIWFDIRGLIDGNPDHQRRRKR